MNLSYSEEYEVFRSEVGAFLRTTWPKRADDPELSPSERARLFRERAIEAGYLCRNVPKRYGGAEVRPDVLRATIIREEFAKARAPGEALGLGPGLLVPTLLEHGSEWQKEKLIRPTILGDIRWCQGYSEPGSGSDLASLQTRAELRSDEWIINGQKIWTSGAQVADYMFCLCRTEPDAPKHAGISYLLIDMRQPGIEVRPLRQMTGTSGFNEVFFTNARTPADWIVGRRGEGWIVSRSTLKHERNMIGSSERAMTGFRRLVRLARATERNGAPAIRDPEMRQRLIAIEGYVRAHTYSGYIQLTRAAHDKDPGAIQLMNKLIHTNVGHACARVALDLIADTSLLAPEGAPMEYEQHDDSARSWVATYMGSLGSSIAGGTANIQRNIIAERALRLPRDAAAQRNG
jgi:alkylation response protein AidB-like acyl-CoA dehydrogenase